MASSGSTTRSARNRASCSLRRALKVLVCEANWASTIRSLKSAAWLAIFRSHEPSDHRHGITIVADCVDYDEAEARALAAAAAGDGTFISPYSHPDVIAGAGTVALEILEDMPDAGAIVVPTGGGGLLSGVAIATDRRVPVIGVEPALNPAFTDALAAGHTTTIAPGDSLADGLLGNLERDALTFALVRDRQVPVHLVPEAFVVDGVRALFAHERLVAEGAGAIAVGALLAGSLDTFPGSLVLLVTGANIDAATLAQVIGS